MRIFRLPSFTSTLSSDQTQPQDIFTPPIPASVIIHSDSHPDLVFHQDNPYSDGYPFLKKDVYHDQDVCLHPLQDDKDSAFPSPTLSNFSCTYSRDTCITTPCGSFPASPASATFAMACLPENVALPSSAEVERTFFSETASVSVKGEPLLSSHTALPSRAVSASSISPASSFPSLVVLPPATDDTDGPAQSQPLRAALAGIHSESHWSITTTASSAPSAAEPGQESTTTKQSVKTPKQRHFISLFSRFSPGRNDTSTASTTSIPSLADNHDLDDSDGDNNHKLEEIPPIANVSNPPIYEYLRTSEYSVRYQILHPTCVFPREFARGDVASDTWVREYGNNFSQSVTSAVHQFNGAPSKFAYCSYLKQTRTMPRQDEYSSDEDHQRPASHFSVGSLTNTSANDAMKDLQLQVQTLVEENRSLKEEVKRMQTNKPKQGSKANPEVDELIAVFGKNYGIMIEMFPPPSKLFQQPPPSITVEIIS
ncbi:hypothetical protein SCLCIDRAFT_31312 [Scleroderma citrinum Foug A]|uniref:Uncharacterized protein n=1 Tax=Scleroderma citrinum Foug A TaxID=1036808 RepID=A0A0C2YX88_9AGAM|nr:hypothetical protein SCLCIDRAFT_31312 [Scleroderma citrinum Foug A]